MRPQPRTELFADSTGRFVHDLILEACRKFPQKTALVDSSLPEPHRIAYGEYGELLERIARAI